MMYLNFSCVVKVFVWHSFLFSELWVRGFMVKKITRESPQNKPNYVLSSSSCANILSLGRIAMVSSLFYEILCQGNPQSGEGSALSVPALASY